MAVRRRSSFRIEFTAEDGEAVSLAADLTEPARPNGASAVFMPGFGSVRNGEKAVEFARAFAAAGFAFLAFEPRGHGDSSGTLEGLTLDRHLEDLRHALGAVKPEGGAVVGVGSSLGALALAAHAASRPRAFAFLVGIGAAFGFHEKWSRVKFADRPPTLTSAAIRSARVLRTSALAPRVKTPMLLWHGMKDDAVRWQEAARFAAAASSPVELRLLGDGDHRLTRWKTRLADESATRARQVVLGEDHGS
jgi:pimeloyl-ACP methyl ester carboxylesterase